MLSTTRKELAESIVVSALIGSLALVAQWLIQDEIIRSIVIGFVLIGVLAMLTLPHARRFVSAYFAVASVGKFFQRSSIQHQLIHQARDLCVKLLPAVGIYEAPPVPPGHNHAPSNEVMQANRDAIISLLEHVVRLFEQVVPSGTKVWVCLRDRRADDHYHTFARAGHYTPARAEHTKAMHKDRSKTIQRLKDSYDSGSCVIVTGSTQGPQMWEEQPNTKRFPEDLSVLMGAVMTKSWVDEDWGEKKLAWILTVNVNREGVFNETHIPLMQGCVDVFSTIVNLMLRTPHIKTMSTHAQQPRPNKTDAGNGS